ncbi:MAG TPA: Ig-like domain-containing protein, partial [Gemmatimonadaceae bacterium]|nr:Ig-like domain-containing protein [Gemmatimonadaceae bacterium]
MMLNHTPLRSGTRSRSLKMIGTRLRIFALLAASTVVLSADTCDDGLTHVDSQQGDVVVRMIAQQDLKGWTGYNDSIYVLVFKAKPGVAYTSGMSVDSLMAVDYVRISWQSSNTNVVAVVNDERATSEYPRIRYVGPGTAVLTARLDDPRLSLNPGFDGTASTSVIVTDPATKIRLSPSGGTIQVGQSLQMTVSGTTASGSPATPSSATLTLYCVDEKCTSMGGRAVAGNVLQLISGLYSIGSSFNVDGIQAGTARLIAILRMNSPNGLVTVASDTVTVNVLAPVVPSRVTIDPPSGNIFVGGTKQLSASVFDASNNLISTTVSWRTSDPNLATVAAAGLVTAVSTGSGSTISNSVQIVAKAAEGVEATATFTIYKQVANVLVEPNPKSMDIGSTHPFTATLRDNNGATIPPAATTVTWSTGNSSIATVDASGLVTANSAGTTTVIATTTEGIRGIADLTVAPAPLPVVRVVVSPANITLPLSAGACQFTAHAFDANGNEVIVSGFRWIVDASNVASVDQNGLVLL